MKRKNPFPGVTRIVDQHGTTRFRYRCKGFSTYLPGPYASVAFRAAYDAAVEGAKTPNRSTTPQGTLAWLIEAYLGSPKYRNLSDSRKRSIRGEMDWLRGIAGDLPFAKLGTRHIEALMGKKTGPTAANTVKKNLSLLFNFAIKREMGVTFNPARYADRLKENPDGYHTWTESEIDRFLDHHGEGTKARLACLLALNTGASRQDLSRMGWQNVTGGRIAYRRGKTHVGADLPILDALRAELQRLPADTLLFLTHGQGRPYKPETLGNWFRDQCRAAGVPGSLHGLRKAGATRLANAGATPDEIRAFLAHATNKEGSTYTGKADRSRLADSGMAKLSGVKQEQNLSNIATTLDTTTTQPIGRKAKK
ncbi:MAG: tyrosine-type recombinase/integrase [Rhodobacteraceae bacterium]|nr:tyrosine-type recombinase/integrase [Paracoccaceae bacterium]